MAGPARARQRDPQLRACNRPRASSDHDLDRTIIETEDYYDRYAGDIQEELKGQDLWGEVWRFGVAKNFTDGTAGDEVVLGFSGLEGLPEGARCYLIDESLGRLVNIEDKRSYHFFLRKRDPVLREEEAMFMLLVGSEEFIDTQRDNLPRLPVRTALYQNYPNPFNPETIIRYDVARTGRVSIRIYSATGALVKIPY